MEKGKWLVFGILGLVMVIGLTGCIISTSPGTGSVIEMNPGDTKVFKVSGVNLNSSISKCVWSIDRMNGNDPEYLEGIDQVEFTVNTEGEKSNKVKIVCGCGSLLFIPQSNPQSGDILWMWTWVPTDYRIWNIRILRNTVSIWQGDYYIEDSTDIQVLNGYTEVTGSLSIANSNIKTLTGLENLTTVGGDVYISENSFLTTLTGLENLTSIVGNLDIIDNTILKSLSGLGNLTSIGGDLGIYNNDALTSLSGLENITSVGSDLIIDDNAVLTNLSGLENIISVGGELHIQFNPALTTLSGLEHLISIDGGLVIRSNDVLTSLSGLENIISIGGCLWIEGNYALTVLGMAYLQKVGRYFYIYRNPLLCTSLAEELMNQILAGGGIGGGKTISGNKECTTP